MYSEVINEMSTRTASVEQILRSNHHGNIETIVPTSSNRVVLIYSKNRGSDWDLASVDECDRQLVHENEDSGLQADADCSLDADASVTTRKVACALHS